MKRVHDILKELNTERFVLEIYSNVGGVIGYLDEVQAEGMFGDIRVRDNEYFMNEIKQCAFIKVHEQDNMPYIEKIYRFIAMWKHLIWEEHGQ